MATLSRPIIKEENGFKTISSSYLCPYLSEGWLFDMYYKVPSNIKTHEGADAFLMASVIPSMKLKQDIEVHDNILCSTVYSISEIQNTLSKWYFELENIKIIAKVDMVTKTAKSKEVACFFSGGVDSMYTLLKHFDEITTLVFVHGFDMALGTTGKRKACSDMLRDIAKITGKKIIEVETNIRYFSDQFVNWDYHYSGSAMASVAMLLSETIGKIYIPPSLHKLEDGSDMAWGSHPDLDNLWSSKSIEIVYDDDDRRTRVEKIRYISNYEIAHEYLRVCWQDPDKYNCSVCEKCVRTMTALYIEGISDVFKTFENVSETELASRLSAVKINSKSQLLLNEENYGHLQDGVVKSALEKIINDFKNNTQST